MKLMLPVAGMVVAAGSCCCCGLDPQALIEGLEEYADQGSSTDVIVGGEDAEAAPVATAGGSTEGLCGRLKSDGLTLPSGLSVLNCGNYGGSESLLLQGSGSPKDACAHIKGWASGAGWTIKHDVESMGSYAITATETGHNMTIACSDSGGRSTVSVSITAG